MALFGRPSAKDDTRELAYRRWFGRQHPLALVSLLLSAFSLTHFGTLWVDELAGIGLGVVALVQLKRARAAPQDPLPPAASAAGPARVEGDRLAWAGIVVGLISLACAVVIYFFL